MTRSQIATLLGLAAARDRRTIGQTDVEAWFTDLGDLDFTEARDALNRHFRESTDWLMPAHIRRFVAAARGERRKHHEIRALPSRFEDDAERAERVKRGVAACAEALSIDRPRRRLTPTPHDEGK